MQVAAVRLKNTSVQFEVGALFQSEALVQTCGAIRLANRNLVHAHHVVVEYKANATLGLHHLSHSANRIDKQRVVVVEHSYCSSRLIIIPNDIAPVPALAFYVLVT